MADEERVVLTDDDGNEQEFEIVDVFELDDERYAVLLPINDEEEGEEAVVLKMVTDENGEDILVDLTDEEFEKVSAYWDEMVEEDEGDDEDDK